MGPAELETLISEWSLRTGHGFRAIELKSLVEHISYETEYELEQLRQELTPVNNTWEDA